MSQRHILGTSQTFDNDLDQNWTNSQTEESSTHLERSRTTDQWNSIPAPNDSRSFSNPMENMASEVMPLSSHQWNSIPAPNGFTSGGHNDGGPYYQSDASGPSRDPFLHSSSTTGIYSNPQENSIYHASSSSYNSETWVDDGIVDLTMSNVRGPQKRKSPVDSSVYEMGSSSRYFGDQTSSELPLPAEMRKEKSNLDSHYMPWGQPFVPSTYRSNGLSMRGESSSRDVRNRPTLDSDANSARTHFPSNFTQFCSTGHIVNHAWPSDLLSQNSNASRDWNCARVSANPNDTTSIAPETSNFLFDRKSINTSVEMGGYHHISVPNRNPGVAQGFPSPSLQSANGVRRGYSHRSIPSYRSSSSSLQLGPVAPPEDGSHPMVETYPSRHLRPLPNISWRSNERNGRRRSSHERFRPPFGDAALRDRFASEGFMVVDRAAYYASRNMVDQHRDMRLDVDNMTYEELIALGERIGSVNTGLSENLISRCLSETLYCLSDQTQDGERCAICLDEYKVKDEIGSMKTCGHDYHVGCIKKWLSMKNSCPICKASALSGDPKNKTNQ